MNSSASLFDFDAMLMYGFVTDADLRVCEVNQSLQKWMSQSKEEGVHALLHRLRKLERPDLCEFVDTLLDPESEAGAGYLFERCLRELHHEVVKIVNEGMQVPSYSSRHEGSFLIRREFKYACDPNRLLLAIRMVKPGGSQLIGGTLANRVDFVGVCIVVRPSEDRPWAVKGFQGQLQDAWLRLEPLVQRGSQLAAVALMGRNLSHNIGSHALFWLRQDTGQELQDTKDHREQKKLFYAYLRDRMELLGSVGTFMPSSLTTWRIRDLVSEFTKNQILLERLCRSEGVGSISITCEGNAAVAIPGGRPGVHLFFSILENSLRDSAKYARDANTASMPDHETRLNLRILVDSSYAPGNGFVRLVIHDDRRNFQKAESVLRKSLDCLRVVDETGKIVPGSWGVKERLACAVMLRGHKFEDIPLTKVQEQGTIEDVAFATYAPDDEPRFLDIVEINENLGWEIFLLRPAPSILFVDDSNTLPPVEDYPSIKVRDWTWMRANVHSALHMHHRFVVARTSNRLDLEWLASVSAKLPSRLFVTPENDHMIPGSVGLKNFTFEDMTDLKLQRIWTEVMLSHRRLSMPIVAIEGQGEYGTILESPVVWAGKDYKSIEGAVSPRSAPLIVVRPHTHRLNCPNIYYEPHEKGDPLRFQMESLCFDNPEELALFAYRMIEASLVRILLVDERIDRTADYCDSDRKEVSWREILAWKGIDVHGKEYGTQDRGRDLSDIERWLSEKDYNFLVLHMGIAEKIAQDTGMSVYQVYQALQAKVDQLVVHSGRPVIPELPPGVKFMLLSNVTAWIDYVFSKIQIVDELFSSKGA